MLLLEQPSPDVIYRKYSSRAEQMEFIFWIYVLPKVRLFTFEFTAQPLLILGVGFLYKMLLWKFVGRKQNVSDIAVSSKYANHFIQPPVV